MTNKRMVLAIAALAVAAAAAVPIIKGVAASNNKAVVQGVTVTPARSFNETRFRELRVIFKDIMTTDAQRDRLAPEFEALIAAATIANWADLSRLAYESFMGSAIESPYKGVRPYDRINFAVTRKMAAIARAENNNVGGLEQVVKYTKDLTLEREVQKEMVILGYR